MSEMKDFLKALVKNPEAKELLKGLKEPSGVEEAAEQYAAIAEKLGYNLSAEELSKALKAEEETLKAKTAKATDTVKEALDETALNAVAGGVTLGSLCDSTADTEEWCWFSDFCSYVINYYNQEDAAIKPDGTYDCGFTVRQMDTRNTCPDNASNDIWEEWRKNDLCPDIEAVDCISSVGI